MKENKENGQQVVEKKKSSILPFVLVGIIVFALTMGCSYFMFRSLLAPFMPEETAVGQTIISGVTVSAGEFTTNAGSSFLKTEIHIVIPNEKSSQEQISQSMPAIKDTILTTLNKSSPLEDREVLKTKIKDSINKKLGADVVLDVYFTSFIIQ